MATIRLDMGNILPLSNFRSRDRVVALDGGLLHELYGISYFLILAEKILVGDLKSASRTDP